MPAAKTSRYFATAANTTTVKTLRCAVGAAEYCLEIAGISAIMRGNKIAPNTESATPAGWVQSEENSVPVYDLAQQFQTPPNTQTEANNEGFALLLQNNHAPLALKVDRIIGSLDVPTPEIIPLPKVAHPYATTVFKGIVSIENKWTLYADPLQLHPDKLTVTAPAKEAAKNHSVITPTKAHAVKARQTHKPQVLLFSSAQARQESANSSPIVFGLSLTQVQQILDAAPILPVPFAPSFLVGITNWRGSAVPVIDLQARLGLTNAAISPQQIAPKSRLLVARTSQQNELFGILITPQVKAFALPIPSHPNTHALTLDPHFMHGIFDLEGMPLIIPDLDRMLTVRSAALPQPLLP